MYDFWRSDYIKDIKQSYEIVQSSVAVYCIQLLDPCLTKVTNRLADLDFNTGVMPKRKPKQSLVHSVNGDSANAVPPKKKQRSQGAKSDTSQDDVIRAPPDLSHIYPLSHADIPYGIPTDSQSLRIVTWNVTSLRAIVRSGVFKEYIDKESPHVLCLQETKMTPQAESEFCSFPGYTFYWYHSERKGYSGVAIAVHDDVNRLCGGPCSVSHGIRDSTADSEGRVLTLTLSNSLCIVNAYVPHSGAKLARLQYRISEFEPSLRRYLSELSKGHHVVYCGDLNVAHREIDIHDSKSNIKNAGHTPEERQEFGILLSTAPNWVDCYREFHPTFSGYTFYSRRFGSRMRDQGKGWRLDYFVVDRDLFQSGVVQSIFVRNQIEGSDHRPLVMDVDCSNISRVIRRVDDEGKNVSSEP